MCVPGTFLHSPTAVDPALTTTCCVQAEGMLPAIIFVRRRDTAEALACEVAEEVIHRNIKLAPTAAAAAAAASAAAALVPEKRRQYRMLAAGVAHHHSHDAPRWRHAVRAGVHAVVAATTVLVCLLTVWFTSYCREGRGYAARGVSAGGVCHFHPRRGDSRALPNVRVTVEGRVTLVQLKIYSCGHTWHCRVVVFGDDVRGLTVQGFWQMAGRAGRRGTTATSGHVRSMCFGGALLQRVLGQLTCGCVHVVDVLWHDAQTQVVFCNFKFWRVRHLMTQPSEPLQGFLSFTPSFVLHLVKLAQSDNPVVVQRLRRAVKLAFASFGAESYVRTHSLMQLGFSLRWLRHVGGLTAHFEVRVWPCNGRTGRASHTAWLWLR